MQEFFHQQYGAFLGLGIFLQNITLLASPSLGTWDFWQTMSTKKSQSFCFSKISLILTVFFSKNTRRKVGCLSLTTLERASKFRTNCNFDRRNEIRFTTLQLMEVFDIFWYIVASCKLLLQGAMHLDRDRRAVHGDTTIFPIDTHSFDSDLRWRHPKRWFIYARKSHSCSPNLT